MEIETTKQVCELIKNRAGRVVAIRVALKVLTIVCAKLSFPRLNLIDSAPSGHLKTWTSNMACRFFPPSWTLSLKSDFTLHGLYEDTKGNLNGKCLQINDGTLLFSSKAERTKQRLINGLAEWMTDEIYKYRDWNRTFIIHGRGTVSLNLTTESYNQNLKRLLGNTFDERCLTVHSELSQKEFDLIEFSTNRRGSEHTGLYPIGVLSKPSRKVDVTIPEQFEKTIRLDASEYSWRSVKGYPRSQATIRAMLRANAFLNGRTEVCKDDFWIVEQAKELLINPLQPNKPRIVQMLRNRQSVADICKALNKDYESYNSYVYRVLNEAKGKGLLT